MKILEIHIYGYGKLENVALKNLQDIQVFYGENEAGKSTIMSFIHSVLFGFPTKQQNELRLEPKKGSRYGGQLLLQFYNSEKVLVERVKGKATGDVTVRFADGRVGGEEDLTGMMANIDKSVYHSIFSFNLHRLQYVHGLKNDDLGKFLFSTGTLGTERLLTLENQLQKELDQRFKPGGKKPTINEKLLQLKDVFEKLKKAERQNDNYGRLLTEREEIEREIHENQEYIHNLQKQIHQLEEWDKLLPVVREKEYLQTQLEKTKVSFPIDGIARLDATHGLLKPLEAQIKILEVKKQELQEKLNKYLPNQKILELEADINRVLGEVSLYDAFKEELRDWQAKSTQSYQEMEELKGKLHVSIDDETIEGSNTSLLMMEKTAQAEKMQARLQERKDELDKRFATERDELERLEGQIELLKEEVLPETERQRKKERLKEWKSKDAIEKELQSIEDRSHLLQLTITKEKERLRQNTYLNLFMGALVAFLIFWGISQLQWLPVIIGVIGMGFLSIQLLRDKKDSLYKFKRELETLKEKEHVLRERLKNGQDSELTLIEEQLKKNETIVEKLTVSHLKWEQQNLQYERVIEAFEAWEHDSLELQEKLKHLGKELRIPEEIAFHHIHTAFRLIDRWKECKRNYEHIQGQLLKKTTRIERIENEIRSLCERLDIGNHLRVQEAAFSLKEALRKEHFKQQNYDALQVRYDELIEGLDTAKKEYTLLKEEEAALFDAAGVESEEEYRLTGRKVDHWNSDASRAEELKKRIEISPLAHVAMKELTKIENVPLKIEEIKKELAEGKVKIQEGNRALAELNHRIGLLEEGGVYGELLHHYRQLQSELDLEAKEWAKFAIAKEMLERTVKSFKEERLPAMLVKAEEYLAFLTEGQYTKIFSKTDSDGFLIERKDRLSFEINELSQATMEQVYVALRLALVTTIYKKYPFPILIDDSFVNFDHNRTARVFELLMTIKSNQILFFTCHHHLLPRFNRKEVLMMEEFSRRSDHSKV